MIGCFYFYYESLKIVYLTYASAKYIIYARA
nr:MAG TPA: hypothetical protein [Caudoviricetes sp.]